MARDRCFIPAPVSPAPLNLALRVNKVIGTAGMVGVLTDMHVDEVLSVLIDGTPHVRFALLVPVSSVLAAPGGVGGGLLLDGGVNPVRYHGFVRAPAIPGVEFVVVVRLVAVFMNHLAWRRVR